MSKIFISYRRDDSAGHTGRLLDWLTERFGQDLIFRDLETIEAGEDFVKAVQSAVASCDVLIAVIGRQWASCVDDKGQRRLDNAEDLVRFEIKAGLSRNVNVIPVLVQGVSMPKRSDLPDDLKGLANINAIEVSDRRWDYDVGVLGNKLAQILGITLRRDMGQESKQQMQSAPNISIGRGLRIENSTIGTIGASIVRGKGLVQLSARDVNVLEGAEVKGSRISEIIGFKQEG